MSRWLRAPALALLLLAAGCPKPVAFVKGEQALRNEEFPRAAEYFELALKEKPGDPDTLKGLKDARRGAARVYFQRAMGKDPDDLWGRFDELDAALSFAPDSPELVEAMADVEKRQRALQQQIDGAYEWLNADQPARAMDEFKPATRYERFFPALKDAWKVVVRQYCHVEGNAGLTALANLRADEARKHWEEVLRYEPENTRAKAGLRSLEGLSRLEKRDFESALGFFREAVTIDSGFDFARERLRLARRGMLGNLLREGAQGLDRAQTPAAITKLMDLNAAALSNADQTDPERDIAAERLKTLRQRLGQYYLKNATDALAHNPPLWATALASFRAARQVEPELTQPYEAQAAKALAAAQEKQKLNLVIHFEAERGGDLLTSFLHEGVVAAIDAAGMPGLNLVTREHLRDLVLDEESLAQGFSNKKSAGVDLETADLILLGRVVKNKVSETGADPMPKLSKHVSGYRQAKNPALGPVEKELAEARAEVVAARNNAESASSGAEALGTALSFLPGMSAAKDIGKVAGAAGKISGNAEVNAAERKVAALEGRLAQMPPTIDVPIVSSYSYKEFKTTVNADMRVSFRLIDRRTSLMQKAETVQATQTKTGMAREGVDEASDQNGLKNLDGPLPDKEEVRTEVQNELQQSLSKRVIEQVGAFRRARWANAAKSAKTQRDLATQLESSLLLLDLVTQDDETSTAAEEFAFETAGLSRQHRRLAKYRSASVADNEVWPAAPAAVGQQ